MIKALIVDDERLARSEMRKLIGEIAEFEIVEAATHAEAVDMINEEQPDIVFLDVQLNGKKTGFDVLSDADYAPQVVFSTAFDEYAIKAFELNAIDYLLKPIDSKRLEEAIKKVKKNISQKQDPQKTQRYLDATDSVFVKDGEKCWFVKLGEVRLFESAGNYSKVFFGNNRPLILKSLNALEEKLDPKTFFRANRKHIVNLKMISRIEPFLNGGYLLYLNEGEEIELSRRQAVKFRDMMSL